MQWVEPEDSCRNLNLSKDILTLFEVKWMSLSQSWSLLTEFSRQNIDISLLAFQTEVTTRLRVHLDRDITILNHDITANTGFISCYIFGYHGGINCFTLVQLSCCLSYARDCCEWISVCIAVLLYSWGMAVHVLNINQLSLYLTWTKGKPKWQWGFIVTNLQWLQRVE